MGFREEAEKMVSLMTQEEKVRLFIPENLTRLAKCEKLNFSGAQIAEGIQKLQLHKDKLSIELQELFQTTDYPAISMIANSFDEELVEKLGEALGEECLEREISILAGIRPNIKRNPLRGHNEKYMSEDPYLNGKLAAGIVRGIQNKGVGACVTCFGADSRETAKMQTNAIMDERAFHEIYGRPFEMVVREADPYAMQTSYQKMNGVSMVENAQISRKILRDEWKYEGALFSAYGMVNDCITSLEAGIDLEMGAIGKESMKEILSALEEGEISEKILDQMAVHMVELILKLSTENRKFSKQNQSEYMLNADNQKFHYDRSAHRKLAWTAAQESAVLLKNTGILPLKQKKNIAVVGALAKYPRFQTGDCSKEFSAEVSSAHQVFLEYGYAFGYADGYPLDSDETREELLKEAMKVAEGREAVILFLGNPKEQKEDATSMLLPENQRALLDAIMQVNTRVILVIQNHGIVRIPHLDKVEAVLLLGIAGGQGGRACVNLLSGQANPCGKLAETFPISVKDIPGYRYFWSSRKREEYRESIFVGYRYYDTARRNVAFPFGYGLSYTRFSYGQMEVSADHIDFCREKYQKLTVDVPIKNTGDMDGKEIVQLYIHPSRTSALRPEKELKGFAKVFVPKGEERLVTFQLTREDFAYYSPLQKQWVVENGTYEILIGSSSRNILQRFEVEVVGVDKAIKNLLPSEHKKNREMLKTYFHFPSGELDIPDEEFHELFIDVPGDTYEDKLVTADTTVGELESTFFGKAMLKRIFRSDIATSQFDTMPSLLYDMEQKNDMPIYAAAVLYGRMSRKKIMAWIDLCNHKFLQGIMKMFH